MTLGRLQNLTVMLTDLEGFTERTSQQSREENARMLQQHDTLLVPILRRYRGHLVQKRGDALLAVFKSPTESVRCGMAMQDALWRFNQEKVASEQLHVRVCIHTGEVVETIDGLRGEPVNVVTAVENVAEAGEVVFTESVYLSMNRMEVTSESWTTLAVPGREERLQLHRCQAAPQGLPFGGMDLQRGTASLDLQSALLRKFSGAMRRAPKLLQNLSVAEHGG